MRFLYILAIFLALTAGASAQQDANRLSNLESRVSEIERKVSSASQVSAVIFLFGAFCALWAQNTGRSAWLWFFLGLFFSVITVLVLLSKNSQDRRQNPPGERTRISLDDSPSRKLPIHMWW